MSAIPARIIAQAPVCDIFDEKGRQVGRAEGQIAGDSFHYHWEASGYPVGVYFARIGQGAEQVVVELDKSQ
jgi:hypothetical protein